MDELKGFAILVFIFFVVLVIEQISRYLKTRPVRYQASSVEFNEGEGWVIITSRNTAHRLDGDLYVDKCIALLREKRSNPEGMHLQVWISPGSNKAVRIKQTDAMPLPNRYA